jgi:hypothetical protein
MGVNHTYRYISVPSGGTTVPSSIQLTASCDGYSANVYAPANLCALYNSLSFGSSYAWYGELYAGSTRIGYRGTSINLAKYRGQQISGRMIYQGDSGHGPVNAYLTLSSPVS